MQQIGLDHVLNAIDNILTNRYNVVPLAIRQNTNQQYRPGLLYVYSKKASGE